MPKFVIERELPGAGKLSPDQLQSISQKSCSVLRELGPEIQWLESYVTDDKIYCIYIAPDENIVREHGTRRISRQPDLVSAQDDRPDNSRVILAVPIFQRE